MKVYCDKCKFVSTWEGRSDIHWECKANYTSHTRWNDGSKYKLYKDGEKINRNSDCPKFKKRLLSFLPRYQFGFGSLLIVIIGGMLLLIILLSLIFNG